MKKFWKIALMAAFGLCLVLFAASCGKQELNSISIDESNPPRKEYVMGQELDLSQGKILLHYSNGDESLPLSSSEVTVSGYDPQKFGSQKLSVSCRGMTTEYSVSVSRRMTAEGITTDYFVGESMDLTKGQIRLRKDDGTSESYSLTDERVTIEEVEFLKAESPHAVTVRIRDGNTEYTGTIQVYVYEIGSATLTRPSRVSYQSHESKLDLSGGYITLRAKDGNLTRSVPVTEDMARGFDPSEATIENRSEPLQQKIIIAFGENEFEFMISIRFSDVSVIRLRAESLKKIEWTGEPSLGKTEIENAIEAAGLYVGLSPEDKTLIAEEDLLSVVRAASRFGAAEWESFLEKYADTFTVKDGKIVLIGKSAEATERDLSLLKDEGGTFGAELDVLSSIRETLGDMQLFENATVQECLGSIIPESELQLLIERLDVMLALHEASLKFPADWTEQSFENVNNVAALEEMCRVIATSRFVTRADREMYGVVSAWRKGNDLFEILYTYYYQLEPDTAVISLLKEVGLPGELESLYRALASAVDEFSHIEKREIWDSTRFMLYCRTAEKYAARIENEDSNLHKRLYSSLTFNGLLSRPATFRQLMDYVLPVSRQMHYACVGMAEYEALWDEYLEIFVQIDDSDYRNSEAYERDVEELQKSFVACSTPMQYNFLTALNIWYDERFPDICFDHSERFYNEFVRMIAETVEASLPQAAQEVYRNLQIAAECFANRYNFVRGQAVDKFHAAMEEAERGYQALSAEERRQFDEKVGYMYEKYLAFYKDPSWTEQADLGDWEEKFEEIASNIRDVNQAYVMLSMQELPLALPLLSAYERAERLARELLESAPEEIVDAFYNSVYPAAMSSWSLDQELWTARGYRNTALLNLESNGVLFYDLYQKANLNDFLADASPMIWEYLAASMDPNYEYHYDLDGIVVMMNKYRELDAYSKTVLPLLDGMNLYFGAIRAAFAEVFSEDAMTALDQLLNVERSYADYELNQNTQTASALFESFQNQAQAFRDTYVRLSSWSGQVFDSYLKDMADYYLKLANL